MLAKKQWIVLMVTLTEWGVSHILVVNRRNNMLCFQSVLWSREVRTGNGILRARNVRPPRAPAAREAAVAAGSKFVTFSIAFS